MRRPPGGLTVLAAALAMAGCSGRNATPIAATGGNPAAAGPHSSWDVSTMPDPCTALRLADVRRSSGLAVAAGVSLDSWPPLCSYRLPGPAQEFLYVSADSRPAAADDFSRQHSDSPATQDITGVGDRAYWLPDYTALHVLAAGTHITVSFAGSAPPPDARAAATAVARAALR